MYNCLKSIILSSPFLKTLNTAVVAGMPLLCRLATESCRCWKLIAQWIICQSYTTLHLVFITLTLLISLSFLLCCPHACCSPSLHLPLFISHQYMLWYRLYVLEPRLIAVVDYSTHRGCSEESRCACVHTHTHTHTFSDGGLSSYFSVFDLTCLGGGSIHCAKPCGLPQKKQNILCVCMSVLLCELQTDTHTFRPTWCHTNPSVVRNRGKVKMKPFKALELWWRGYQASSHTDLTTILERITVVWCQMFSLIYSVNM